MNSFGMRLNLCLAIFLSLPVLFQSAANGGAAAMPPHKSQIDLLIAEAEAADDAKGAKEYSDHLIKMLVAPQVGTAHIAALSHRLAMADLMARQGKRERIPESSVAQAFNDLMEQVTDPPSKPLQTDASVVHRIRLTLYSASRHLSSVDSHPAVCLPSEAVLVMYQLLANNGAESLSCPPQMSPPPSGPYVVGCARGVDAQSLVFHHLISHSRSERATLYDHTAQILGF